MMLAWVIQGPIPPRPPVSRPTRRSVTMRVLSNAACRSDPAERGRDLRRKRPARVMEIPMYAPSCAWMQSVVDQHDYRGCCGAVRSGLEHQPGSLRRHIARSDRRPETLATCFTAAAVRPDVVCVVYPWRVHLHSNRLSQADVLRLYRSFRGSCAFPGCPNMASLPDGTPLLEVAHIASAHPTGPRFSPELTRQGVNAFENLILVCTQHHIEIDRIPPVNSVAELVKIRDSHLRRVAGTALPPIAIEESPDLPPTGNRFKKALWIWRHERGNNSEEFWHRLIADCPELLTATTHGQSFVLNSKCYVGGKSVNDNGGNVVDFLAQGRDTILVEIKVPTTRLLGGHYRGNIYLPSRELVGAVAQIQHYRASLQQEMAVLRMNSPGLVAHNPTMVVIAGDAESEGFSPLQLHSFELYRQSQTGVLIRTYDEVFETIANITKIWDPDVDY